MKKAVALFFVCLLLAAPVLARNVLTIDLASDHVDITTGFNGAFVTVYGVRELPGEVAVVIRGPKRKMSVRRKSSVMGAWVNTKAMTFKGVPSYYAFASSDPEMNYAAPDILKSNGIGMEYLNFVSEDKEDVETLKLFREALVRNKRSQKLFPAGAQRIEFLSDTFFKTEFYIPAHVPVGEYKVQTFYFSGGVVRDVEVKTLRVAQVGVSAQIKSFAHSHGLTYGMLCVLLAIFAGWFSNRVSSRA